MNEFFKQYQTTLLKFFNSSFKNVLVIPHVEESKIIKVYPNGVAQIFGDKIKWYFWGSRIIEEQLLNADFKYKNLYRYCWLDSTFNSTASGDGFVSAVSSVDWATVRNATTGNDQVDSASTTARNDNSLSGSNRFIYRIFLPFDTSSLSDGATIESATLRVEVTSVATAGHNTALVVSTQASNTALVADDYDNVGSTEFTGTRFDFTSTGTKTQSLNASGLANISTTGYSVFAMRAANDLDNSEPAGIQDPVIGTSDNATPSNRPLLTVVTPSTDYIGKRW